MASEGRLDAIIIGGSYAGLAAAMALGRSVRNVAVIDSGLPCNRSTPHSHNFLTQDGRTPAEIADIAREQVRAYDTVRFVSGMVTGAVRTDDGFTVTLDDGAELAASKLLFATGIRDIMPATPGFAECWGISVLHCPYCHGYEVREEPLGVVGNGDAGFDLARMIHHWSRDLTLFTDGASTLSAEQRALFDANGIAIVEESIATIEHRDGSMHAVSLADGSRRAMTALFARLPFEQHCAVPRELGCDFTKQGLIAVDELGATSVPGVYAAGDNSSPMRAVASAVAAGTKAGAALNRELIAERFSAVAHV